MRKIILLCAAGMSTSIIVTKMREEAGLAGVEATIEAYPVSEAAAMAKDADIILLGPQVRFNLKKVQSACPGVPVEAIDMKLYGKMDGKGILALAQSKMKA